MITVPRPGAVWVCDRPGPHRARITRINDTHVYYEVVDDNGHRPHHRALITNFVAGWEPAKAPPRGRFTDRGWLDRAACLSEDPELFFPVGEKSDQANSQTAEAKAVCKRCQVQAECLDAAGEYGIWAGTTPDGRRRAKRRAKRRVRMQELRERVTR